MTTQMRDSHKRLSDMATSVVTRSFRQLALTLGLSENPVVKRATGHLSGGQYRSFLLLTDSWTTQQYSSSAEHRAWNQLACYLKKYPFDDPSIDTESAAMSKFDKAEAKCRRVNQRFRARARRNSIDGKPLPYSARLECARRWIEEVIGESPNLQKIYSMCDFGPGASVGVSGSLTHKARKLCEREWSVTPTAAPFAYAAMVQDHHVWELLLGSPVCYDVDLFREAFNRRVKYVSANKIITVPKTAMVDRTIAIEPSLNGYVQKGVDLYLRAKLKRVGIDLADQALNQELARQGTLGGFNPFCTIDLSSASDTVTIEIVRALLPPDWFTFLNRLRSPSFTKGDTEVKYEKFTSMGNGFCFPLESLIFAAIVHSAYEVTGDCEFAVYGDDIIVRQSSALLVLELLKYCGFTANVDKTFCFGPFRESCGADYFEGVNVRPYYLDNVPRKWSDVFGILNGLRRVSLDNSPIWWELFHLVPTPFQYVRTLDGPDTAITVERDVFMASPHVRWHRHEQRWSWKEFVFSAVGDRRSYDPAAQMYGLLRGQQSSRKTGEVEFTHRRKTSTRTRWC